jgi:hypothetical protein
MRLLTALGQDVGITVREKPRDRAHGRIRILSEVHARGFDQKIRAVFRIRECAVANRRYLTCARACHNRPAPL